MVDFVTREFLKMIRPEINAALAELGKKHGVKLSAGNGSYGDGGGHFKLQIDPVTADGTVETPELRDLKAVYPEYVGLVVDVPTRGRFKVVGYRTRARKNPFVVEKGGKRYNAPESFLDEKFHVKAAS